MDLLTRIELRNFQIHKKLDVDLAEGVTTIVGPSDRGKSAVLRALRWVLTNKPGGDAFRRHGSKVTSVKLFLGDHTIERIRSNSKNQYVLDGEILEAFGANVPDVISALIEVDDLNFQGQHDAPYWLSLSAGEVNRQLNELFHLQAIDTAFTRVTKGLRESAAETDVLTTSLRIAKQDADDLEWMLLAQEEWARVTRLRKRAVAAVSRTAKLRTALARLRTASEESKLYSEAFIESGVVLGLLSGLESVCTRRESLEALVGQCKSVEALAAVEVPETADLEKLMGVWRKRRQRSTRLQALLSQAQSLEKSRWQFDESLKQAETDFQNRIGSQCPLCGSEIG